MDHSAIRNLMGQVATGELSADEAATRLRHLPFEDMGFARVDHHRALRCGFPEVIFGLGKTPEQIVEIFARLADSGANVLATRVSRDAAEKTRQRFLQAEYHELSSCLTLRQKDEPKSGGFVAVAAAGTSDLPVAEEARITADIMGQRTKTFYDVGVAGIHRLLAESHALQSARVVIVVAGMEGALPSVVGGLVDTPVIAVPTSVGYGASFGGLSALLTMMNSCAAGVSVVNIDNGFGAGYQAALINRVLERAQSRSNEDHAV